MNIVIYGHHLSGESVMDRVLGRWLCAAMAAFLLTFGGAGVAWAQRDIVADSASGPNSGQIFINTCNFATIATGCLANNFAAYGISPNVAVTVFEEGLITFDYPSTGSLTGPVTLHNLPTTPYMIASLGAAIPVVGHRGSSGGLNVNWLVNGVVTFQVNIFEGILRGAGTPRANSLVAYSLFAPTTTCTGPEPDYAGIPCPIQTTTLSPYSVDFNDRYDSFYQYSNIDSLDLTAVPEPGAWALMITGLGAAGAALRRRRRLAASG